MPTVFKNPFYIEDLRTRGESLHRMTLRTSARVHSFIEGVHGAGGEPGVLTTVNLLLNKVYELCQRAGIREYDPLNYERAVCAIVDHLDGFSVPVPNGRPGSPTPVAQPPSKAPTGNDRRRVAGVAHEAQKCDLQHSNTKVGGPRKGRRKVEGTSEASNH